MADDKTASEELLAAQFLATHEWAIAEPDPLNPGFFLDKKIKGGQVQSAWGLDYLGGTVLAASAHETAVVEFSPRRFMQILAGVTFYTGTPDPAGDIASLRCNEDSGNNYWSRHAHLGSGGVWEDEQFGSTNLIRLAETNSRLSRNVMVTVLNNLTTRSKTFNIKNQTGTNNAAVIGSINVGGGEWVNTTAQINRLQMINAGANNIGTGSGFIVLGRDL